MAEEKKYKLDQVSVRLTCIIHRMNQWRRKAA